MKRRQNTGVEKRRREVRRDKGISSTNRNIEDEKGISSSNRNIEDEKWKFKTEIEKIGGAVEVSKSIMFQFETRISEL